MVYSVIILNLYIPSSRSLKEKRHRLKPIIHRLHKEFNLSVAELDKQDRWNESVVGCALLSNDKKYSDMVLSKVVPLIEMTFPEVNVTNFSIQFL